MFVNSDFTDRPIKLKIKGTEYCKNGKLELLNITNLPTQKFQSNCIPK